MNRRRVIVGLVVLALVAVLALSLWPQSPRPLRATFEQVRDGMTYDEVCAMVGGPPGDYSNGKCYPGRPFIGRSPPPNERIWNAIDATLFLVIDPGGRVRDPRIMPSTLMPEQPIWERLRSRLGL